MLKRVVIAGGGTGGHLYPGLAVAEALKLRGVECHFVGTRRGMEAKVVPERGFPFHAIRSRGLSSNPPMAILALAEMFIGWAQSLGLLSALRAQLVIGLGGYVCAPTVAASAFRGVPAILLEQNSFPGKANRLLSRLCSYACVSFEGCRKWLPHTRVEVTGNPVRAEIITADRDESRAKLGIEADRKVLLVTGASQGAASLNEAVLQALPFWKDQPWTIFHLTGARHIEEISTKCKSLVGDGRLDFRPMGYCDEMDRLYAAADLLVCRAGATTLAELTCRGLPAILVPYPFAAEDHQEKNAQTLVEVGAGILLRDSEVRPMLGDMVAALMEDEGRRQKMATASRELGRPQAVERIIEVIEKVCGPLGPRRMAGDEVVVS